MKAHRNLDLEKNIKLIFMKPMGNYLFHPCLEARKVLIQNLAPRMLFTFSGHFAIVWVYESQYTLFTSLL
jgi:hypothetical protein